MVNKLAENGGLTSSDIRKVMSHKYALKEPDQPKEDGEYMVKDGRTYKICSLSYKVSKSTRESALSLVDRGANGGLAGSDVRVIERTQRTVDITGIDNHQVTGLPIVTAAAKVDTTRGPVIVLLHQYAYLGQGKSIHSAVQMEHYEIDVNDKSRKVKGGKQSITTLEGNVIPLKFRDGLAYMDMSSPTDEELLTLPHIPLTSDEDWDPSIFNEDLYCDDVIDQDDEDIFSDARFDEQGRYNHRVIALQNMSKPQDIARHHRIIF